MRDGTPVMRMRAKTLTALLLSGLMLATPLAVSQAPGVPPVPGAPDVPGVPGVPDAPTVPGGNACHANAVDDANAAASEALASVRDARRMAEEVARDAPDMAQDTAEDTLEYVQEDAVRDAEDAIRDANNQVLREVYDARRMVRQALEDVIGPMPVGWEDRAAAARIALEEAQRALDAAERGVQAQARGAHDADEDAAEQALREAQDALEAALAALEQDARDAARDALLGSPVVVWTNLNMGHGSCLDADTLDGWQAQAFWDAVGEEAAARILGDAALRADMEDLGGFINDGAFEGASLALSGEATMAGPVGIGTADPVARLHVVGGRDAGPTSHGYLVLGNAGGTNLVLDDNEMMARRDGQAATLFLQAEGGVVSLARHSGSVGIGTQDPRATLDVRGDIIADTVRTDVVAGDVQAGAATLSGRVHINGTADANLRHGGGLLQVGTAASNLVLDGNEILARKGEAAGTLTLQAEGGKVKVGWDLDTPSDLEVTGHLKAQLFLTGTPHPSGDAAEPVVGSDLAPGDVVVMDGFTAAGKLKVRKATTALDPEVVGVVSTDPTLRLAGLATDTPLAVTGIVPVKVHGPVAKGDLLTTSAVGGHAQACDTAAACDGAVLGKALEAHHGSGAGRVRVLVALA